MSMAAPTVDPSVPAATPPEAAAAVQFSAATTALYAAFGDVAHRPDMVRCRHCVTPSDVSALAADVSSLSPEVVSRFVAKVGTTWGDGRDLLRIAPRALHLAADHQLGVNRSVLLDKLAAAGWSKWTPGQVDAVCRFLLAEWGRLLASNPRSGHSAHHWLRQTAAAIGDLDPFLDRWAQALAGSPGPPALHLAVVLVQSDLRPDFPASVSALFHDARSADQFATWLDTDSPAQHLNRAAQALGDTSDARRLSLAVDRLSRFRAARTRG